VGNRHTDNATFLYPQKLALKLPTSGGRSVGEFDYGRKATEFVFLFLRSMKIAQNCESCIIISYSFCYNETPTFISATHTFGEIHRKTDYKEMMFGLFIKLSNLLSPETLCRILK
jgi:hypothetical protein